MRSRKTVEVEYVKNLINGRLEKSDETISPEARLFAASILEKILFDTGNYEGYSYLYNWTSLNGKTHINVDYDVDPPAIVDETRRVYY